MTRLLIIEDNEGDSYQIQNLLSDSSEKLSFVCVKRLAEGIEKLRRETFDLVLLDLTLPDSFGLKTFLKIQEYSGATPVIIFSSLDFEEIVFETLRLGAASYLVKGNLPAYDLVSIIESAVCKEKNIDNPGLGSLDLAA